MSRKAISKSLKSLSKSVALIPLYSSSSNADAPPTYTELGLNFTRYKEQSLDPEKVIYGSSRRYDIEVSQGSFITPLGRNWSFALDVQHDAMTGASPWFVGTTNNDRPGVIMSGASISDNRTEISSTTRYYFDNGNAGVKLSHSEEDDYKAKAASVDISLNSPDNLRTYTLALSGSKDTIRPTQGKIPTNFESGQKDTKSMWIAVSQIFSKTVITKLGFSYTRHEGNLSDPYKLLDLRPRNRSQRTWNFSYRQHLNRPNAALRMDYRYYDDTWGIDSHTLTTEWYQNFHRTAIIPYLRYYSQSKADFFSTVSNTERSYYSDDYRLCSFGAITVGVRAEYFLRNWRFELQAEKYRTDDDWGVSSRDSSPALVEFWRASLGVRYRF